MTTPSASHSLWELTVLCFLREGPMHPYELQRLVKERHKDEVLVLKRGSLYHAINRLHEAGLIAPVATTREGRRPERTVYEITEEGRREVVRRLQELIAVPQRETPVFMASVSYLLHLAPEDAVARLESRAAALEEELGRLDLVLKTMTPRITRLNLLETEYACTLRRAELQWVRELIDDLRAGRLAWDTESILASVRAARERKE